MHFQKTSLLFFLLLMLGGCIGSTKHTAMPGGCLKALQTGDRILVGVIPKLSANRSYQLYQQLEQEFRQKGLAMAYVVEQEFDLASKGIKPNAAPDSVTLSQMRKLGYTHYLGLAVGNVASAMMYERISAQEHREIQQGYGAAETDDSKATVHFKLYSTEERKAIYNLATTTKMSGVTLPGKEYEEGHRNSHTVNLSTASLATEKALKKGARELMEKCKAN
ncbi:hypothetical protein H9Q13_17480 [Pontibacter sp. JH31]|uniref:Lipoprotein n=1 Tax=Pontibacter aquaedesilientis TaxID=2766980 RepID=A0ABR7XL08_9BACT|nr:hypothetical protein [Pontibacter aquaedesilientis]MBD1398965.1 hypothetical protein [Pontibacter aquaedesilientis]